jgi:hypothetical protein
VRLDALSKVDRHSAKFNFAKPNTDDWISFGATPPWRRTLSSRKRRNRNR